MCKVQDSIPVNRQRRGFTLIELLVVITIIALLLGILIVAISKGKAAAERSATEQYMGAISLSIKAYYNDFQAYPPSVAPSGTFCGVSSVSGWKGSELLAQALVGALPKTSDHQDGPGWRQTGTSRIYGPYLTTGQYGIISSSNGYALTDTWEQPIQYYRAHYDVISTAWGASAHFASGENDNAPNKVSIDDASLIAAKYLLISIGPDGKSGSTATDADNIAATGP